jgi:hypothetical protein
MAAGRKNEQEQTINSRSMWHEQGAAGRDAFNCTRTPICDLRGRAARHSGASKRACECEA